MGEQYRMDGHQAEIAVSSENIVMGLSWSER